MAAESYEITELENIDTQRLFSTDTRRRSKSSISGGGGSILNYVIAFGVLANLVVMSLLLLKLHSVEQQVRPILEEVKPALEIVKDPDLVRSLKSIAVFTDATVTLFGGSIAELIINATTVDLQHLSNSISAVTDSVHNSLSCNTAVDCGEEYEPLNPKHASYLDRIDCVNWTSAVALWMDFASSFMKQVAQVENVVPNPTHRARRTSDENANGSEGADSGTGSGGLLLEPLVEWFPFLSNQLDLEKWKTATCACHDLILNIQDEGNVWSGYFTSQCTTKPNSYGNGKYMWEVDPWHSRFLNNLAPVCKIACDYLGSQPGTATS